MGVSSESLTSVAFFPVGCDVQRPNNKLRKLHVLLLAKIRKITCIRQVAPQQLPPSHSLENNILQGKDIILRTLHPRLPGVGATLKEPPKQTRV